MILNFKIIVTKNSFTIPNTVNFQLVFKNSVGSLIPTAYN